MEVETIKQTSRRLKITPVNRDHVGTTTSRFICPECDSDLLLAPVWLQVNDREVTLQRELTLEDFWLCTCCDEEITPKVVD